MTKILTCGNCAVFRPGPGKSKGTCYLSPPTPVLAGMQQDPLGRPQPVVAALRPMVDAGEFCGMWQPAAAPVGLPDRRHPGSDTFTPRQVTAPASAHRPVKTADVDGGWQCADCQATGLALDITLCPGGKTNAETQQ